MSSPASVRNNAYNCLVNVVSEHTLSNVRCFLLFMASMKAIKLMAKVSMNSKSYNIDPHLFCGEESDFCTYERMYQFVQARTELYTLETLAVHQHLE